MPVLESAQASEPRKLYEQANHMTGKWTAATRVGLLLAAFIALLMVTMFLINPVVLPRIQAAPAHPRGGWSVAIAVSLGLGVALGMFLIAMLGILVRISRFEIFEDHLRISCGMLSRQVCFKDIQGIETRSVQAPLWPRYGSFWRDLMEQMQVQIFTPHYMQIGHGQFLEKSAELILIKTDGKGWWKGYMLEVDNPGVFKDKLADAMTKYREAA